MDDFSALAARIAVSVGQLRGCIILTRDGLVVGSFPPSDESPVQRAWLRFAALGDPEKGFVEFGDEMWVYVRRGPYAAFALADTGARPGLVMDQLQQLLLTAEEARTKRDAVRLPDVADAPKSKPRTPLHKGTGQAAQPPSLTRAEAQPAGTAFRAPAPSEQASPQSSERHARPLSWILAPEEESPPPPARPERRPVSWILAPQEDEPVPLTPAERRSENRTWILPPQEEGTQELSALASVAPVSAPAPAPPPVTVPEAFSLPDLEPDLEPDLLPRPAAPPEPVALPDPEPRFQPDPELELLPAHDPEPASSPDPDPEPELQLDPGSELQLDPEPELDAAIEPEVGLEAGAEQQGEEVDRFLLAQEFSRLLEDTVSGDESG